MIGFIAAVSAMNGVLFGIALIGWLSGKQPAWPVFFWGLLTAVVVVAGFVTGGTP